MQIVVGLDRRLDRGERGLDVSVLQPGSGERVFGLPRPGPASARRRPARRRCARTARRRRAPPAPPPRTMAKSPLREATSWNPVPTRSPFQTGNRARVRHSSAAMAVTIGASKKAAAGYVRRPAAPSASSSASSATATSGISAAGSPCTRLPPTVPRLRVWRWPTKPSARASRGRESRTAGDSSASRWRVIAPIATPPSPAAMPASPSIPSMSTSRVGRASRIAISGTSVCPPAMILCSSPGPAAASARQAAATLSARI